MCPKQTFRVLSPDIYWSIRTFILVSVVAFTLSILIYLLSILFFSQPEIISETIETTAEVSLAKVTTTAQYSSLMISILLYNTIAMVVACTGSAFMLYIHKLILSEFKVRHGSRFYNQISRIFEQVLKPLILLYIWVVLKIKPEISNIIRSELDGKSNDSVWFCSIYKKEDYTLFAYTVPYAVPILVLIANGTLIGILFAYTNFINAHAGFVELGLEGAIIGIGYAWTFFISSIVLHGLIEIPVILFAVAIGYRFAKIQSSAVIENNMFSSDYYNELKKDVNKINEITTNFLMSPYLWTFLILGYMFLAMAAFIEVNYTPLLAEWAIDQYYILIQMRYS